MAVDTISAIKNNLLDVRFAFVHLQRLGLVGKKNSFALSIVRSRLGYKSACVAIQ